MWHALRSLVVAGAVFVITAAMAAPSGDWPQFGRGARHLGTNPSENTFTAANVAGLRVAWAGHFGDNNATEGGAVIADSRIYVTDFDGRLSAFDLAGCGTASPESLRAAHAGIRPWGGPAASCEPLWRGRTRNDITSTPAVAHGLVYVASADRFLHAFDAAGCGAALCDAVWRGRLQSASIDSSVTVSGGLAFVGDFGGRLYAFAATGCGAAVCDPLWTAQAGPHEQLTSTPAVGDGHVFIATTFDTPDDRTGRLLVFSLADCSPTACTPAWTADLGGPAGRTAAPLVAHGKVFVGSGKRFGGPNTKDHLFAFSSSGCGGAMVCLPVQVFDVGEEGLDGAPALSGHMLFASTNTSPILSTVGVVAAFDVAACGARCPPRWTGVNFTEGFVSPPVVVGEVVFVGKGPASGIDIDSGVFAYDARGCGTAKTCRALTLVVPGPQQFYLGAPLAVAHGRVAFVSNDNTNGASNVVVLSLP
jgi:outer membrane protein assembly factor BamB